MLVWSGSTELENAIQKPVFDPAKKGWHAGGLIAGSVTTAAIIAGLSAKGVIDLPSK